MKYKIIVYKAGFDTVEKAAYAESDIDWQGCDPEACNACTECFAALDLQSVLKRKKHMEVEVAGQKDVDLKADVLIYVGERCARDACEGYGLSFEAVHEAEGYRICGKKVGNTQLVLIYGGSRAGTLYGVAAYMEYHGIRFVSPGDAGTYYNSELDRSQETEFDIKEVPSFKTRESYSEFIYDSRYELLLWLVHNKMNSAFMNTISRPEVLHKLCLNMSGGGHTIWYEYMDINQEYPYRHKIFGGEEKPLDPYPVSAYYEGDVNNDGILTYGEAHPEWYAETNGKRNLIRDYKIYHELDYATGDYICTCNEDGVTELCKIMVDSLSCGAMKDLSCIKLFALDNGNWCQCEKCRGLSLSYRQLMLAYKLDKAIKQATKEGRISRKILITIPAYHETLPPPDRPLPDDFDYDTISVTFYVIERCYVHNINDKKCTETNKMLYDQLISWTNGYYKGELTIGEYYNVSSFASMPFIFTERMFNDIPFYYQIGARHMHYMHMTASNWGIRAINDYVYAKLLWNVAYDKEILKQEYYTSRYGIYADKMRLLYEQLEMVCANCKSIKHYQFVNGRRRSLVTELREKQKTLFDYKHMKLDGRVEDYQAGPSLTETVHGFEKSFNEFCSFIRDKDVQVFQEDREQLEYGLNMLKFIYYKVLEALGEEAGNEDKISFYAKKLRETTRPLDGYDVRKLFKNGLTATRMLEE